MATAQDSPIWSRLTGALAASVVAALLFRYLCHAVMVALALWNEARPAPHLPDLIIDHLPRVRWIAVHNYHLWVAVYVPLMIWLWRRDRRGFIRFLWVGGVISLLRGVTIAVTGLGPVHGPDGNAGIDGAILVEAWWRIVNPLSALGSDALHVYLTKDMFFSGHTASTFLLWLYCRPHRWLGPVALVGHLAIVAVVFLAHLHYTIDVIGAWAVTYAVYAWFEHRPAGRPA